MHPSGVSKDWSDMKNITKRPDHRASLTVDSKCRHYEQQGKILHEYCTKTTAHGLQHISEGKHTPYRVIWGLILIGILAGSCFHLSKMISSYLEYNYYTSITMDGGSLKVSTSVTSIPGM